MIRTINDNNPKPPNPRKAKAKGDVKRFYDKRKPNSSKMKKAVNWIKGVVTAENKAGETVHGFLDLMPIPNQVIAKIVSYLTKGKTREAQDELKKLLTIRNGVALLLSIAVLTGLITVEDFRAILQAIGEFL